MSNLTRGSAAWLARWAHNPQVAGSNPAPATNFMKMWLDDVRDPREHGAIGFTWVKTVEEAINLLQTGKVTFVSLDHDLGIADTVGYNFRESTGYDVVCWMERNDVWPVDGVAIHSANPVGRARMQVVIDKHYRGPVA